MAKVSFKMPEAFLLKASKLAARTDEIIPRVLEAGGEVVLEKVKDNLSAIIGRDTKLPPRSTGELLSSLGLSGARQDKNGDFNVKVGFDEPRSGGGSNAKIANILEYGRHGQPAKPFLAPAKSSSKKACIEAMSKKLEEEIDAT
jgi:HK97 gp10 family phage protein